MKKTGITKRIGSLLVQIVLAMSFLCGCSSKNQDISVDAVDGVRRGIKILGEAFVEQPVEYEPCTLRFSWKQDETKNQAFLQVIEAFEQAYPGISVEGSGVEEENWEEVLLGQLSDQTAADINQISWEWIQEYSADASLFYDLYKEYEVLNLGTFGQKYLNLCTVAEELQAIPAAVTGRIFLFDATLFEQAGIPVPSTQQELMDAGESFRVRLGEEYYPLALNTTDRMELLIYYLESQYGKDWIVNGVLQYDVEEVTKGMEFLLSLEELHVIPTLQYMRSADSLVRDSGFNSGCYGGVFVKEDSLKQYQASLQAGHKIQAGQRFADMGIYNGGYVQVAVAYAVSENCAHPREAAIFLNFLLNQEESILVLKDTQGIPLSRVARSLGEEQELWDKTAWEANQTILEDDFAENPELAASIRDDSVYKDVLSGLSYGDYNAREAAQLLMDGLNQ